MSLPFTFLRRKGRVYVDVDDLMTWLITAQRRALALNRRGEAHAFADVQGVLLAGVEMEP